MIRITASLVAVALCSAVPASVGAATYCTEMPSDEELALIMSVDDPSIGGMSGISTATPFRLIPKPSEGDDTPIWCASPNDPRCSPTNAPQSPTLDSLLELRFAGPDLPIVAAPRAADVQYLPHVPHVASGVRNRVERPPRG
jgi:hypothetical protein